jgi:catechol 2,3-dioxygenase-like lactoylglutathione lyase family enzyme
MARTIGFDHVATVTADLDRIVTFYQHVFEARATFEMAAPPTHPRMVILDLGGGSALNVTEQPAGTIVGDRASPGSRGPIDHYRHPHRAARAASMHRAASRRSTGMPPAMLAATSATCRSPSEHGSTPCTASAAAAKSMTATWRPRNGSHSTSTATCRKSSRSSHARCAISSSAAASVGSQPFDHARIASARSSKHVVRRGVLRVA